MVSDQYRGARYLQQVGEERKFYKLRDAYLKSRGVVVHCIDVHVRVKGNDKGRRKSRDRLPDISQKSNMWIEV